MANSKSNNRKRLTREDLLLSPEFWIENIRTELFNMVNDYMVEHKISRKGLADKLGVSKGYISQLLNGDSDHRISSLASLATALGKAPYLYLKDLDLVLEADKKGAGIFLDFTELESKAEKCDLFESIPTHALEPSLGKYIRGKNVGKSESDFLYIFNPLITVKEEDKFQEPQIEISASKRSVIESDAPQKTLAYEA